MLGVAPGTIERMVRDVNAVPDVILRDMILFAMKCARAPQTVETHDYTQLRAHGLNEAEILELVAMAGLAVYANILADATAMEPDEVFGAI